MAMDNFIPNEKTIVIPWWLVINPSEGERIGNFKWVKWLRNKETKNRIKEMKESK